MTPEELKLVQDMLEAYKHSEMTIIVCVVIWLLASVLLCIWEVYKYKQTKKMHNEWKCSLTEEQIKVINKNKEYTK